MIFVKNIFWKKIIFHKLIFFYNGTGTGTVVKIVLQIIYLIKYNLNIITYKVTQLLKLSNYFF